MLHKPLKNSKFSGTFKQVFNGDRWDTDAIHTVIERKELTKYLPVPT